MKIVRVMYTAKPEFAAQNKINIQAVMDDLRKLNEGGINYHCCCSADGKSFTHTAFFKSDEDQKILNGLPAFKSFQEQLKNAGFEQPPVQELLSLVGSSVELFQT